MTTTVTLEEAEKLLNILRSMESVVVAFSWSRQLFAGEGCV